MGSYKEIITVAASVKRPTEDITGNKLVLDSDLKEKLKNFNKADFEFYETMNRTFWEVIDNIGPVRVNAIKRAIVDQATDLQKKCIAGWDKQGNDFVPFLKDEAKQFKECQRIELVRTEVIKTLQSRQKQMVVQHRQKLLQLKKLQTVR